VHQIIEASGGVAWKPRTSTGMACSFCGATKVDVSYLIAGPGVLICDACVGLARQAQPEPAGACSFCDKEGPFVAGPGVRICEQCLEFCAEVLEAQA
jgi:ATP-dependent protease Clp ATPase subunit